MAKEAPKVKVRMTACMAGERFVRNVGDVVEVSPDEAKRLAEAGFAVEVEEKKAEK